MCDSNFRVDARSHSNVADISGFECKEVTLEILRACTSEDTELRDHDIKKFCPFLMVHVTRDPEDKEARSFGKHMTSLEFVLRFSRVNTITLLAIQYYYGLRTSENERWGNTFGDDPFKAKLKNDHGFEAAYRAKQRIHWRGSSFAPRMLNESKLITTTLLQNSFLCADRDQQINLIVEWFEEHLGFPYGKSRTLRLNSHSFGCCDVKTDLGKEISGQLIDLYRELNPGQLPALAFADGRVPFAEYRVDLFIEALCRDQSKNCVDEIAEKFHDFANSLDWGGFNDPYDRCILMSCPKQLTREYAWSHFGNEDELLKGMAILNTFILFAAANQVSFEFVSTLVSAVSERNDYNPACLFDQLMVVNSANPDFGFTPVMLACKYDSGLKWAIENKEHLVDYRDYSGEREDLTHFQYLKYKSVDYYLGESIKRTRYLSDQSDSSFVQNRQQWDEVFDGDEHSRMFGLTATGLAFLHENNSYVETLVRMGSTSVYGGSQLEFVDKYREKLNHDNVLQLIQLGLLDLSRRDEESTLLHRLIAHSLISPHDVDFYFKSGAPPAARDSFGRTLLHASCIHCDDPSIIESFIRYTDNVNSVDADGLTALDYYKTNEKLPHYSDAYFALHDASF